MFEFQYIYLAIVAVYKGSVLEIAQYGPYYIPLNVFTASKRSSFYLLFVITAAGVVPCGGPKKSTRTSAIVQIILFLSVLCDQLEYSK